MVGVDIKRVQSRLLEMAVNIRDILERNEIPYEIAFGTLLGAVRHGGFIPWDDDFDFFLFDDTYDKAMDILRKELPSSMFLENLDSEPNYFHAWAHVKDLNSMCKCEHYPQDELYSHHGVSVDLYRLKKIKTTDFSEFRYQSAIDYIDRRKQLGMITDEDYLIRKNSYESRKEKDVVLTNDKFIYAYPFDIGFQLINDVMPLKKYKFQNEEFYGPANADSILSYRYGSYMTLPSEESRIPHYTFVQFED